MFKTMVTAIFMTIMLIGCTTVMSVKTDNATKEYAPTKKKDVQVYVTADAGREYIPVAEIVAMADANEDSEKVVNLLKAESAEYGADAIVNLRFEFGYGYWTNGLKGYATAVKFTNK